jgi:hypothetical protein
VVIQQLRETFGLAMMPRHLIFDRDSIFSAQVVSTVKPFGIRPTRTAYRSPWQNGVAERWVGSVRRELLDHVVVMSERHLRRLLREYIAYSTKTARISASISRHRPIVNADPHEVRPPQSSRFLVWADCIIDTSSQPDCVHGWSPRRVLARDSRICERISPECSRTQHG